MFSRSLEQIETNNLSGATSVLGCFGGEDTFSDLILAKHLEESEPLQFKNLNARLERLRNETFQAARKIASRTNWSLLVSQMVLQKFAISAAVSLEISGHVDGKISVPWIVPVT